MVGQGLEVHGIYRGGRELSNLQGIASNLTLFQADLNDGLRVAGIIRESRPDLIFHLAAQAAVPQSWQDPAATLINNAVAELNLLQGILKAEIDPAILVLGSNEEYGLIQSDEIPVKETNPFRPVNPYAVSKIVQDMLAYQYFASHKLRCIRLRPFNHIGPRQTDTYVAATFARQVAEAEAELREPVVKVGNLEAKRDFSDVRDIVRGYYLALTRGEPGEVYNIGSGKAIKVREILDFYLAKSRIPISVVIDETRMRPSDVPIAVCDYSKLHAQTGWMPEIPLETTLADILDYWRDEVKK